MPLIKMINKKGGKIQKISAKVKGSIVSEERHYEDSRMLQRTSGYNANLEKIAHFQRIISYKN